MSVIGGAIVTHFTKRQHPGLVDHIFIACLECRFREAWQVSESLHYTALGNNAYLDLVRLDGTRVYMQFKAGAVVSVLPSNVITYEEQDFLGFLDIDEDKKGKSSGHISRK